MIIFTPFHRIAIVRIVGNSGDAKVSQTFTQSWRSANIRFGRQRKGARRRRSSYGRSAERPAAARAMPLLGHRYRSLGRRSKRIWWPKEAAGRPCSLSRGFRGTCGVRANALKTGGCTEARSWAGHAAKSATMGKHSSVSRRSRSSRRNAGFWYGFLQKAGSDAVRDDFLLVAYARALRDFCLGIFTAAGMLWEFGRVVMITRGER